MSAAKLTLEGREFELPVVAGTEGETGIDITSLRAKSMAITLDPGYGNTGACRSAITFIDGEQGILRLLAKSKTVAAFASKKSIGQPFSYPKNDLSYTANLLHMMFSVPTEQYEVPKVLDDALKWSASSIPMWTSTAASSIGRWAYQRTCSR